MSVRRNAPNRLSLIRTCHTCGKVFPTTADSPWMRQLPANGKKQKICYFCSTGCYQASYIHKGWYDGLTEQRRKEKEARRDIHEKNRQYYAAHADEMRARRRAQYWADPETGRAESAYYRRKRKLLKDGENARQSL